MGRDDEDEDEGQMSSDNDLGEYSDDSSGESSCESESVEGLPPQRLAFVVMTCVIGGYTLIGPLQHTVKHRLQIGDEGPRHELFTQYVALVQWAKTIMTLGQNVFLSSVLPITRVYLSMFVMFVGVVIPPVFIFALGSTWIEWVSMSYFSIGLALGVFEATYLSVISPLGPSTKSWAIMGFPAAFAIVNILGQSLMALFDMPVVVIMWYIVLCMPVAAILFRTFAPASPQVDGKSYTQASLNTSLMDWRSWFLRMVPFLLVNIVSHFVMESVLPAVFNTYNAQQVSLLGPENNSLLMKKTWFLVVFSISVAVGDMVGRKAGYCFRLETMMSNYLALAFALCCSIMGLFLTTRGIAALTWFSVFLAFFGSGFNYAVTSKYIDKFLPRKYNLVGYSVWMFVGYCGAISGAVLVTMVMSWICQGHMYEFQCLNKSHR